MASKPGNAAKMRIQAGTLTTPGMLANLDEVVDITLNLPWDTADVSNRSKGWKQFIKTLGDAEITVTCTYDPASTVLGTMRAAAFARGTVLGIQFLDETGGEGVAADFVVSGYNQTQPNAGAINEEYTLKLADTAYVPQFVDTGA